MSVFLDFLRERIDTGGFSTEDALASFLPLLRQVAAAHRDGLVAPLVGVSNLRVEGVQIWFEAGKLAAPTQEPEKLRPFEQAARRGLEIVRETRLATHVDDGEETHEVAGLGQRGVAFERPVYLPGYVAWEEELGQHDPLSDVFTLGLVLASLTCGLDLSDEQELARFVQARDNLFNLNAELHPVLAKAVVRMTELDRQRRPQDSAALLRTLENYRDQDIDFDFDLARIGELKSASPQGRRELILGRLQQRLFEISRRNRLLHFRQTMQTVNLTWASVPVSLNVDTIRPEQLLTWNKSLQDDLAAGKSISLNRQLRFEEAIYLPRVLDEIRNEARRDEAEFGFAHLRLVLCFLRWWDLKEKPAERFDSPLLLVPVKLSKTKGVRDVYTLTASDAEAEINPIVRYQFKQLYDIDLPECIDLATTSADDLYRLIAASVQRSEPGVTVTDIDRPRIQLIHARARRRLEQYRKRVKIAGKGVRSFLDVDYSYQRDNFHPLGLRLFQTRIRPAETTLHMIVGAKPRRPSFAVPAQAAPGDEKQRTLYTASEDSDNPYQWEFDRCSVTLGNFRYRKMSLVRDYASLIEQKPEHAGFEAVFSLTPRDAERPAQTPVPIRDGYAIVACDPTQSSAIALARTGRDYIIQGPPGTGKSQTITNLIADYVALGKRVLFVCEKRAAIDVVYHRLHQAGLESLCCLIHDSQADKKQFVMDLKKTYEDHLDHQEDKLSAESKRAGLLEDFEKDYAELERFQEAMCATPDEAGLPLRRLLHRAVELRGRDANLDAAERERLPAYAHWHAHRARIDRLQDLLRDADQPDVLASHPLHLLHGKLAQADRPIERVSERLERVNELLEAITPAAEKLGACLPESLDHFTLLVRHAHKLRQLAERDRLDILRADSDLARDLEKRKRQYVDKARVLERARKQTNHWRQKLSADETAEALEQARQLENAFLAFLQPSWWRLRRILRRGYDFKAHKARPAWSKVLGDLQREHEAAARVAEVEEQARGALAFEGDWTAFLDYLKEVEEAKQQLPVTLRSHHEQFIDEPEGKERVLALAALHADIGRLEEALADLLVAAGDLSLTGLQDELAMIEESLDELPDFVVLLKELAGLPDELARTLRRWPLSSAHLEAALARHSIDEVFRHDRPLARFDADMLARHVKRLEQTHDRWHDVNATVVRERIRQRFLEHVRISATPAGQLTPEQKELKSRYSKGRRELEHEFGKSMRYKPIRDLVADNTGLVVRDLKPVWLMSPLSVADTVPLDDDPFDVVIFDEASQVPLEEAVPALFRARQMIVVGDEMQLPPTNFFSAKQDDEEDRLHVTDEEGERVEYDLSSNSFLNHAARKLPATMLGWHYRSRSESLISFSNAAFYEGRLLTVPEVALPAPGLDEIRIDKIDDGDASVDRLLDRPVGFHLLSAGVYEQRRNQAEADYIARLIRGLLMRETGLSIGVVAFSEAQQGEINSALERLARADEKFGDRLDAELEREEDEQFVGLLVKNLENIQGDERDIVILSVCYGPNPAGKMLMNFGPINQNGGERRLNVAFSRAKRHMVIVSSIRHHQITNDYNDGARCLKNYLHYAESASRGDQATVRRILHESGAGDAQPAEAEQRDAVVADLEESLRERGYRLERNVGQSSFRCDLAVFKEGDERFRAGILVDTHDYYLRRNLLERDVQRPRLLRAFGWNIIVVLTKDWLQKRDEILADIEAVLAGKAKEKNAGEEETPAEPFIPRRFLELGSGKKGKFWEIVIEGNQHTIRFGRAGSKGQEKTRTCADEAEARRDAERLVREKLAKGYQERT